MTYVDAVYGTQDMKSRAWGVSIYMMTLHLHRCIHGQSTADQVNLLHALTLQDLDQAAVIAAHYQSCHDHSARSKIHPPLPSKWSSTAPNADGLHCGHTLCYSYNPLAAHHEDSSPPGICTTRQSHCRVHAAVAAARSPSRCCQPPLQIST